MELRDILQAVGAVGTVIASLAVSRHQVGKHEERIEAHADWLASLETATQLLKQKQDSHSEQIETLVRDLRQAVSNLQQIAIDLAGLSPKRN